MRTFIEKLCDRYKVSETDVQSLLNYMEEVHFKKRDLIVREGTKNCNLYFIKTGIWRAYYHKDGVDTTIWFASDGEAAFSVWGYVDNAYSLINIDRRQRQVRCRGLRDRRPCGCGLAGP